MRSIEFHWWQEPHICRLYIGDDLSIHDLWRDEVQYLVDCLEFKDCDVHYEVPRTATLRDLGHRKFFCHHHENRDASRVFLACFGEDGDDNWGISYFGYYFKLSGEETAELVAKWKQFIEPPVAEWLHEGF